jgi:RNA polymerase sigma factor (TIGR02999 family)
MRPARFVCKVKQGSPMLNANETTILEIMYADLGKIAARHLRNEPMRHHWSASDLIHESYIRIARRYGDTWIEHPQPAALWSRVMRNVLIDHARNCRSQKRAMISLSPLPALDVSDPADASVLALVRLALARLQKTAERQAAVVTLAAIHGLTLEETAAHLHVSGRTVKRDVREARRRLRIDIGIQAARR